MKKIFYILASAIVALGAMACQNEVDESINPNEQSDVVSFTVAFDEATRIAMTTEGKTAKFAFEAGDKLYVQPYATLENDEEFRGQWYEFTTEDGKTFSCQSAELVSELAQSGNYANVDSSADFLIRSNEGVDGFNFATNYADLTAETVTLSMSHAVFHFTVPEGTTATLKHTEDIFVTKDGEWVKEMAFDKGEHWVAAWTFSGTLSYSINSVVVKSIEKDFEAGKIYNLGTLDTNMTIANVAALIENAEAGSTITLPAGATITGSDILVINKNITIDGNGATFTSTAGRAINVSGEGVEATIEDLTVVCSGERGVNVIQNAKSVTLNNVNITAANYAVNVAGSAAGAEVVINGGEYNGLNTVNVGADNANVTITGATINCNDNTSSEKYSAIAINTDAENTTITANDCTFNISGDSGIASNNGTNCSITLSPEGEVTENVAAIRYGDYAYAFSTLAEALSYAKEGDIVILIRDAVMIAEAGTYKIDVNGCTLTAAEGYKLTIEGTTVTVEAMTAVEKLNEQIAAGGTITLTENIVAGENEKITVPAGKTVTLNLNGKTISQEKVCTASHELICNNGDLTITGEGTISFKDNSEGDPTFGWGSYTIRNNGNLTIENGTIEHLTELNNGNVVHMYCAVFSYSGNVVINGGTFKSVDYRSVRAWAGSLTINGGNFEGQVWIQPSKADFDLNITGGTFGPKGVDGSSVFVENETHTVDVEITGGTFTTKLGASKVVKGWVKGGQFGVDPSAYVAENFLALKNYKTENMYDVVAVTQSANWHMVGDHIANSWQVETKNTPMYEINGTNWLVVGNIKLEANKSFKLINGTTWDNAAGSPSSDTTADDIDTWFHAGTGNIKVANEGTYNIYYDTKNQVVIVANIESAIPELTFKTYYLNTGGTGLWNQAGAWFGAHLWTGSAARDYKMVASGEANIFKIEVPIGFSNAIFLRMGKDATDFSNMWNSGDNGYWNKTGDLTINTNNCYTITSWSSGKWSVK